MLLVNRLIRRLATTTAACSGIAAATWAIGLSVRSATPASDLFLNIAALPYWAMCVVPNVATDGIRWMGVGVPETVTPPPFTNLMHSQRLRDEAAASIACVLLASILLSIMALPVKRHLWRRIAAAFGVAMIGVSLQIPPTVLSNAPAAVSVVAAVGRVITMPAELLMKLVGISPFFGAAGDSPPLTMQALANSRGVMLLTLTLFYVIALSSYAKWRATP